MNMHLLATGDVIARNLILVVGAGFHKNESPIKGDIIQARLFAHLP